MHTVEFINDPVSFGSAVARLGAAEAIALDIETVNWWDREAERIALIQFAFREGGELRAVVLDAMAELNLEALRPPLELSLRTKAIHNASFDAGKLARHLRIATSPIHDTMLAARRSGDKSCSLKAQTELHLGLALDKAEQRGDWSRRPLSLEQLRYAALDAVCTLLLYEQQLARGLRGDFELRVRGETRQTSLPLADVPRSAPAPQGVIGPAPVLPAELTTTALALLGIIVELSGRYSPEQLAVSVGGERIGLAGWIVDRMLGAGADLDERDAREEIAALSRAGFICLSASRRLEATVSGLALWRQCRPGEN
jgi:3'-5' exonuclease